MPDAPSPSAESLQFDQAEYTEGAAAGAACAICKEPLPGTYFEVNGRAICPTCRQGLHASLTSKEGRGRRFLRALGLGAGASVAGAVAYYAIRETTGYNFGLVAAFLGIFVGRAVRKGAGARGGWAYQGLAMFLTYTAIAATYAPLIFKEVVKGKEKKTHATAPAPVPPAMPATPEGEGRPSGLAVAAKAGASPVLAPPPTEHAPEGEGSAEPAPAVRKDGSAITDPEDGPDEVEEGAKAAELGTPAAPDGSGKSHGLVLLLAVLFVAAFSYALPVMAGLKSPIGLLILGFGLYEAWRVNKRPLLPITGPYELSKRPVAAPAASGETGPGGG